MTFSPTAKGGRSLVTAVGGIVLCGGVSRRMGRPKAWLPFDGEFLLQRVVRRVRTAVDPVVVVAAAGQDLPTLPAEVLLTRDETADRGPLEGFLAGLRTLLSIPTRTDAVFLTGCDAPFLQPEFVRRMVELLGGQAACAVEADGFRHPLAAVYRIEVIETVERRLADDRRTLGGLLDVVGTRIVTASEFADVDSALHSLRNLNTPAEYEAALLEAGV